jgi:GNAT superfamily N-acetyltransferase
MAEAARSWADSHETDLVAREIAGARLVAGDGPSPLARAVGLGLQTAPSDADLDAIESVFAERGQPARVEVATYADPALLGVLAARGYRPTGVFHVLARTLARDEAIGRDIPWATDGLDIARLDRADGSGVDEAVDVLARAFDDPPPDWLLRVTRQGIGQASATTFLARVSGRLAGGACLAIHADVAILFGAGVLPDFRRGGLHAALIHGRLMWARDSGATIACVQSVPGGPTERNARRAGFQLAYAKTVMTREAP